MYVNDPFLLFKMHIRFSCFSVSVFFLLHSNLIFLKSAHFHHIATKLAKTPQICKFVF